MNDFNPYEVLGVDVTATKVDIKKAYRQKSKDIHPDSSDQGTNDEFIKLRRAFDLLSDDVTRAYYDTTGNVHIDKKKIEMASSGIIESNLTSIMDFIVQNDIDIDTFDISYAMKDLLVEQKSALQAQIVSLKKKVNVARRISSKARRKDGGANIYRLIMAKKVAGLTNDLNARNMAILANEMAMKEAEQFTDFAEEVLALGNLNEPV